MTWRHSRLAAPVIPRRRCEGPRTRTLASDISHVKLPATSLHACNFPACMHLSSHRRFMLFVLTETNAVSVPNASTVSGPSSPLCSLVGNANCARTRGVDLCEAGRLSGVQVSFIQDCHSLWCSGARHAPRTVLAKGAFLSCCFLRSGDLHAAPVACTASDPNFISRPPPSNEGHTTRVPCLHTRSRTVGP